MLALALMMGCSSGFFAPISRRFGTEAPPVLDPSSRGDFEMTATSPEAESEAAESSRTETGPGEGTSRGVETSEAESSKGPNVRSANPALLGEAAKVAAGREFDVIYFEDDSFELPARARRDLQEYAQWLVEHANVWVTLEGHSDRLGSVEFNYNLGLARSTVIKNHLIELGVSGNRLFTISYGEERPAVAAAVGQEELALNRRVELQAFAVSQADTAIPQRGPIPSPRSPQKAPQPPPSVEIFEGSPSTGP